MRTRWAVLACLVLAFGACTSSEDKTVDHTSRSRPDSTPTTTQPIPRPADDYGLQAFVADLADRGHVVGFVDEREADNGTVGTGVLAIRPRSLCVDHERVGVYEYRSARERAAHSAGIDPFGSSIRGRAGQVAIVEWVGSPHFYARGRLIVLYLGGTTARLAALSAVLGRTLSPKAVATPTLGEYPC